MISIKTSKAFFLTLFSLLVGISIGWVLYVIVNREHLSTLLGDQNSLLIKSQIIPFHWVIFLIGGVILLTLAYVSWRKYRAIKLKERRRDLND